MKTFLTKQIPAVAAIMAFTSIASYAQPTTAQMVANQVERLTRLLDLTAAQQASATTYFTAELTTLAGLRTSLQTARTALKTAIESGDTGTIATQATQIGSLTGQEVLAQATAAQLFFAVLMPDQQTKYEALGLGLGGFGGPGGPGGGGPGPHGRGGSH